MRKKASGRTTQRGYGWQHQKARKAALAMFVPGQLCARCRKPMMSTHDLELDHDDNDRTHYIGLSHGACNREAGGQKGARNRGGYRLEPPTSEFGFHDPSGRWNSCSRDW